MAEKSVATTDSTHLSKPRQAIQIQVKAGQLTFLNRKLINAFLKAYQSQDAKAEILKVNRQQLLKDANFNSNDIAFFKQSCRDLLTVQVEWDVLDDNRVSNWGVSNYFSQIEFVGSNVEFVFPPKVRDLLSTREPNFIIDLKVQSVLPGVFSLALYENCTMGRHTGVTEVYTVEVWKSLLGVDDEETPTYKEFKYFNAKVLQPAIRDINQYTDLNIDPIFHRESRKVVAISFTVKVKEMPLLEPGEDNVVLLTDRLIAFGCSEADANKIIEAHPFDYILGNLVYCEQQAIAQKIKSNPVAYLISALKNDYRPKETAFERKQREKLEDKNKHQQLREQQAITAKAESTAQAKSKFNRGNELFEEISKDADVLEFQLKSYERYLIETNALLAQKYKTQGLESKVVKQHFITFLADNVES